MLLSGSAIDEVDEHGERVTGDTLLVLLNAHSEAVPFTLPTFEFEQEWQRVVDTFETHGEERTFTPGVQYALEARSVAVFRLVLPPGERRRTAIVKVEAAQPAATAAGVLEPAFAHVPLSIGAKK